MQNIPKQGDPRRKKYAMFLYLILFVFAYFLFRMSFFSIPLNGEEGMFATISLTHPHSPNFSHIARIDGKDIFEPIGHPGFMYEILSGGGYIANVLLTYIVDQEHVAFVLRLTYSLFQLAIWIPLILICFRTQPMLMHPLIALLIFAASPLAIYTSAILQVDGAVGVLLTGFVGIVVLLYHYQIVAVPYIHVLAFLSGVLLGLGKHEWSLACILAHVSAVGYLLVSTRRRITEHLHDLLFSGLSISGVILGNIISYYFDPGNYMFGLMYFYGLSQSHNPLAKFQRWVVVTMIRLPWIFTDIALFAALCALMIKTRLRAAYSEILLFTFSSLLFWGFMSSSKGKTEFRYFAPAFIVFVCTYILLLPIARKFSKSLLVTCAVLFVAYSVMVREFHITSTIQRLAVTPPQSFQADASGCVPWLDTGIAYNASTDFIANSIKYELAKEIVAKYGKTMCARAE